MKKPERRLYAQNSLFYSFFKEAGKFIKTRKKVCFVAAVFTENINF